MRAVVFSFASLVVLVLVALFVFWSSFTRFLSTAKDPGAGPTVLVIEEGATPTTVVKVLEDKDLVKRTPWFSLYIDHFHMPTKIIPGEYELSASMNPVQQLSLLESGKVVMHTVTIPPGSTAQEIVEILVEAGLGEEQELSSLLQSEALTQEWALPGPTLEGYLFPDVYQVPRGLTGKELLLRLVERYRKVVGPLLQKAAKKGTTERELVTIASLVEKSSIPSRERRLYAALLLNRLRAEMPLNCPQSAQYGGGESKRNPWSTKRKTGLPRTPIASPSIGAITAVANPGNTEALYMVERDNRTHVYCPDYDCYVDALRKWPKKKPKRKPHR